MAKDVFRDFGIVPEVIGKITSDNDLSARFSKLFSLCRSEIKKGGYSAICVQGDTLSAYAGALAAFLCGVPVCHLEAGLRTYALRSPFPEEAARRSIAAMTDLHFCTGEIPKENLLREGVDPAAIFTVGNTGEDALRRFQSGKPFRPKSNLPRILVTLHRRETEDERFLRLLDVLSRGAAQKQYEVIFPVHAGPRMRGLTGYPKGKTEITLTPAMSPAVFAPTLLSSDLIITDSGGISEESAVLGIPTLIFRRETERKEQWKAGRISLFDMDGDYDAEIRRGFCLPKHAPSYHDPSPSKTVADILYRTYFSPIL